MASLETAQEPVGEIEAMAADLRSNTVKKAGTVGEYVHGLESAADQLEGAEIESTDETVDEEVQVDIAELTAEKRGELAENFRKEADTAGKAAEGNEHLHVDPALAGTGELGNAVVGGGDGTVNVSPDVIVDMGKGQQGVKQAKNLFGHEKHHANGQQMIGDILTSKGVVTSFDSLEDGAERAGAENQGQDENFRRENQPKDYEQAQERGDELDELGISAEERDRFIAAGDTEGFQQRVIEAELDKGTLTLDAVEENLQKEQVTYSKALLAAVTKDEESDRAPVGTPMVA